LSFDGSDVAVTVPVERRALSRVHHAIMQSFVARGFAPTVDEVAQATAVAPDRVRDAFRQLRDTHGLVLHPGTDAIWIAHPFSASPTGVWVKGAERSWWAPCMWCAMGICVLAAPTATIHARLGGEEEAVAIGVTDGEVENDAVVHFPFPPRAAWDNVVHFCASVLAFRSARDVERWAARHRYPVGAVVPLRTVLRLGRAWYGRHLDEDWRKWTTLEAQAIFEDVGLVGDFWRLPTTNGTF
jgi:hypothetical protein